MSRWSVSYSGKFVQLLAEDIFLGGRPISTTDILEHVFTHVQTFPEFQRAIAEPAMSFSVHLRCQNAPGSARQPRSTTRNYAFTFVSTFAVMTVDELGTEPVLAVVVVPFISHGELPFQRNIRSTTKHKRAGEGGSTLDRAGKPSIR